MPYINYYTHLDLRKNINYANQLISTWGKCTLFYVILLSIIYMTSIQL